MRLNVFTKLVMVQMSVSLFSPGAINRTWRKRVWRLSNNWGSGPHLQSYKPVKMKFSIFSKLIFCSLEARIGWVWSCDTKRSHSSNRDVKMLDVIFWGKSKEFPMLIQSKRGSQFCLTICSAASVSHHHGTLFNWNVEKYFDEFKSLSLVVFTPLGNVWPLISDSGDRWPYTGCSCCSCNHVTTCGKSSHV